MKPSSTLHNQAFSLVELIIVIAIMAVLVGVLAPVFMKYVFSSNASREVQNTDALRRASAGVLSDSEIVIPLAIGEKKTVKVTAPKELADGRTEASIEAYGNFHELLTNVFGQEALNRLPEGYEWNIIITNSNGGYTVDTEQLAP